MQKIAWNNVGTANTPQEIMRLRRQMMDACMRLGQPVVLRHRWNLDDVDSGLAKKCPACYNSAYDETRVDCPVCFGVGYVSVQDNSQGQYIDTLGRIVSSDPGTHVLAPAFGGYDEPFLTWMVEPDVAVDVFRISEKGTMIRTYDAQGIAPWYPILGDNDLCINVTIDPHSQAVLTTEDRFELKMVQQVTIRGLGRRARFIASYQPYLVQQTFRMEKLPKNGIWYTVPTSTPALRVPETLEIASTVVAQGQVSSVDS